MERIIEINILKKIKIMKGLLVIALDNESDSECLSSFKQLFKIQLESNHKFSNEILNCLEIKKHHDCLNILNNWEHEINNNVFKNPCNKKWFDLVTTENNEVRFCTDCNKNVFNVLNQDELIKRKNLRQCVSIDLNNFVNNDLELNSDFKSCNIICEEDSYELGLPW
ncbi:MAG: hypothetical protein V4698_03470 [Bacteroidota bacterium]